MILTETELRKLIRSTLEYIRMPDISEDIVTPHSDIGRNWKKRKYLKQSKRYTVLDTPRVSIPGAAKWAQGEAALWKGKDAYDAIGYKKQLDKKLYDRLMYYYKILGKSGKVGREIFDDIAKLKKGSTALKDMEKKLHWSAAFINTAMDQAGEKNFNWHAGHQGYIGPAMKLRRKWNKGNASIPAGSWVAYAVRDGKSEVEPLIGDLLCFMQPGNSRSRDGMPSNAACCHCDIYLGGGKTVGGNTGSSIGTVKIMSKMP